MKFDFKKIATIIIVCLCTAKTFAEQIYLDELPISITRSEFLKKYPTARPLVGGVNPSRELIGAVASLSKTIPFAGKYETTTARTFIKETSCAAGSAFNSLSMNDAKTILNFLIKRHSKIVHEKKVNDGKDTLIYMTDADSKIGITLRTKQNEGNKTLTYSVTYSVVLNTCPSVVAKDHQVIAPQ